MNNKFIPTTTQEMIDQKIDAFDVILVSGDTYIDSSYNGIAIIGRLLENNGYSVGIIAQPDINTDDIARLGEPKLFWGISAGLVDSMVANYTATRKKRNIDDFTPGGQNNKRPDRASIVYTGLIRKYFKNTVPIVLGGIEASLRRIVHYDFWGNNIRKSLLFDSKADYLIYGMGEKSVLEFAFVCKNNLDPKSIRGLCYISKEPKDGYITLPSFDEVKNDKNKFIDSFHHFYHNNDPLSSKGLQQLHDARYLIQNPPQFYLSELEIDAVYDLPYSGDVHPFYKKNGSVKALETIKFSVTTHQGCYGECNFCAITVHQGRTIRSRSEKSILNEISNMTKKTDFKGYIFDVGGATANMYGYECGKKLKSGDCHHQRCTGDTVCKALKPTHEKLINLLRQIRKIPKVKKAFVQSGIRYDLINEDARFGNVYLKEIVENHISGQMKIAPEHSEPKVLKLMGKPDKKTLLDFKEKFESLNQETGKKQFLTYYMIAAHPGCDENDMNAMKKFANSHLNLNPEQVQIFTPTPSTYSTLMYYTEMNPWTREKIFVEKEISRKQKQKDLIISKSYAITKHFPDKNL
jgi:uncharacterized radical SAM protein YgiQ